MISQPSHWSVRKSTGGLLLIVLPLLGGAATWVFGRGMEYASLRADIRSAKTTAAAAEISAENVRSEMRIEDQKTRDELSTALDKQEARLLKVQESLDQLRMYIMERAGRR